MNITRSFFAAAAAAVALFASASSAPAQPPPPNRSPDEIDQIVGPIALYPDPLVSIVLPASTLPNDVQQAAQVVASGDTASVDSQPWDDSVRAVAHYPDLVEWMSDNIDWTAQLGATFAAQPGDVLNSIQRLRARARAVGTLVDTPQQRVVVDGDLIGIVPVEATRIYVPHYDPAVVFVSNPPRRGAGVFTFSAGFALGAWMTYDFDWRRHSLFVEDRAAAAHRDWTRPSFAVRGSTAAVVEQGHEWHPSANRAPSNVNISRTVVTPHAVGERTANANERRPTISPNGAISATEPQRNDSQRAAQQRAEAQRAEQARQAQPAPTQGELSLQERERQRAQEANRNQGAFVQNQPARPNPQPPSAAPQAQPPPNRALAITEQQRLEQLRAEQQRQQEQRERQAPEATRPVPRGSVTAGASGEYPRPAVTDENKNPPANNEHRISFPNRSDEQHPQPQAARPAPQQQSQPATAPAIVKVPANTGGKNPPNAQARPETDEEKAKRLQQEEEEKKKKKPDGPDGS